MHSSVVQSQDSLKQYKSIKKLKQRDKRRTIWHLKAATIIPSWVQTTQGREEVRHHACSSGCPSYNRIVKSSAILCLRDYWKVCRNYLGYLILGLGNWCVLNDHAITSPQQENWFEVLNHCYQCYITTMNFQTVQGTRDSTFFAGNIQPGNTKNTQRATENLD